MPKKPQGFLEAMIEQFGDAITDNHTKQVEVISTGSLSLDSSIGVGGIPKGMITELFGPEGSGKTTVALNTSKTVVNNGGRVLYIDVENLLNPQLLKAVLGEDFDIDGIQIMTPDSAEDAFIMAEAGIESGEFELIVVDSIGAMASRKEKEVEFDKDTMGQLPKLVGRFIKRNAYDIRTSNIALLILNQVRDNVGSYVKGYKTPGGHQLQHQAAVRISLTRGEDLKRGEEKVGILVKFTIKKNKLAPPFRTFMFPIIFGEGIDYISDLIDFSKLIGVLKQSGPYYKFEDVSLGKGKAETRATLENSKETLDSIVEKVYNIVNKTSTISELLTDMEGDDDETEN